MEPPSPSRAPRPTVAEAGWGILLLVLIVICIASAAAYRLNHDAGWYMYMARVLLDGGTLYRDVVDTNPPLIVWITAIPVGMGRALGISSVLAFKAFVGAIAAISLLSLGWMTRRVWDVSDHTRRAILAAAIFLTIAAIRVDFGQREHLAILLSLPYLVWSMADAAGRSMPVGARVTMAMSAAVGLALKPHLLIAGFLVELFLFVLRRRVRWLEASALIGLVILYALATIAFAPDYVGTAARVVQVYGGLNPPIASLLRVTEIKLYVAAAAMLLAAKWLRLDWRSWMVLFVAATGLLAGAFAQLKGWPYHLYPARVTLVLMLVGMPLWMLERARQSLRAPLAVMVALAMIVFAGRAAVQARRPDPHDVLTPLTRVVNDRANGGPIFVMGMLLYPAFPLVNDTNVRWASRHNSLWFLPGLYSTELAASSGPFRFHPPDEMLPLERAFYEEIVGDLCATPPTVLIVEAVTHLGPAGRRPFDLLVYYGQDARFSHLFAAYIPVATAEAFTAYVPNTSPTCQSR